MIFTAVYSIQNTRQVNVEPGTYYGKIYIAFNNDSGRPSDLSPSNQQYFKIVVSDAGIKYMSVRLSHSDVQIELKERESEPFYRMIDIFDKDNQTGVLITRQEFQEFYQQALKKVQKMDKC